MDSNDDTLETRSICSNTSYASQRSSASATAARAWAKVEAAHGQALFAQKEADMLKAQAYIEEEQQKAAAEAARKKAELQASLHILRLENAAAAVIAKENVLEAAVENEFGELDWVSLKNEYVEHNPSPEPQQDSELPELMPTLMHQLPIDSDEISKYDLPVQRTSKLSQDATPYYPRTQSPYKTGPFKQEHSHSLNPSKDTYRHQTQSHDMRQYSSSCIGLEDCYGSPEAIEEALLKKVDDFPRISNRENQKLRELGDILLELEVARANGFLPGLSYLNTSRGITPIVQKLPYSLHDKWVSLASCYKENHQASYPPFSFFAKFVCDQAKTLNDPSFSPLTGGWRTGKPEHCFKQNMKIPISVKKTEVSSNSKSMQASPSGKRRAKPDEQCPLHNKPHLLRNCRGFRRTFG
ncbi:uncharacterized protein LOC102075783 [Oreochromis niloticus]|uniref:uncharacterized protein LOC102075783 n=1 Tax=Oreochromis niloticus TaxID=8128 RepID=UPI000393F3E5|nr:uncharacterized protein LOC102075783 [Oreochromis niloticus]